MTGMKSKDKTLQCQWYKYNSLSPHSLNSSNCDAQLLHSYTPGRVAVQ